MCILSGALSRVNRVVDLAALLGFKALSRSAEHGHVAGCQLTGALQRAAISQKFARKCECQTDSLPISHQLPMLGLYHVKYSVKQGD